MVASALTTPAQQLEWKPCADIAKNWDVKDRVSECTMVKVPLDYNKPYGRQTEIAVSRVKASDPGKRKGSLVINPGGPGVEGAKLPGEQRDGIFKNVSPYYDLIGFDTRGVGYSELVHCPELEDDKFPPTPPGVTGKERAKFRTAAYTERLLTCANRDPELVRSISTANVARDVDRIREALGERKISYFGWSWGTALGSAYRSMFDRNVDRMYLESVMAPGQFDRDQEDNQVATERLFREYTAWIAQHNDAYGFGATAAEVEKALLALQAAHGSAVNFRLRSPQARWAENAKALADIRDGKPAAEAPKQAVTSNGWDNEERSGGDMRFLRDTYSCNDTGAADEDVDAAWARWEKWKTKYPVAGFQSPSIVGCVNWPFPAQPVKLTKGRSALQLVGHEFETNTVIKWSYQMQNTIGGSLLRVQDDIHSGLVDLPCWSKANDFLVNGRASNGTCPGAPIPGPGQ